MSWHKNVTLRDKHNISRILKDSIIEHLYIENDLTMVLLWHECVRCTTCLCKEDFIMVCPSLATSLDLRLKLK